MKKYKRSLGSKKDQKIVTPKRTTKRNPLRKLMKVNGNRKMNELKRKGK